MSTSVPLPRRILLGFALFAPLGGVPACSPSDPGRPEPAQPDPAPPTTPSENREHLMSERRPRMVVEQVARRGVSDPAVLDALRAVARHHFVPEALEDEAYEDRPLPIGDGQTISQPYVVAVMTERAGVEAGDRVLEIGTGSGYQAAVLAALGAEVFSIEIVESLAERARELLKDELGLENVHLRHGDGYAGWPEEAPFDAILLTAAPAEIPAPLLEQLAPGGRLVAPVGDRDQELRVLTRRADGGGFESEVVFPVRFVPMTGKAQDGER